MNTIQLSKLLYNIDEVKYSLMLSILFQTKHIIKNVYFGHMNYTPVIISLFMEFYYKIYYDFYYIKCISFEKTINKEYNNWKKKENFKYIAKIVKFLHKQVIILLYFNIIIQNTTSKQLNYYC